MIRAPAYFRPQASLMNKQRKTDCRSFLKQTAVFGFYTEMSMTRSLTEKKKGNVQERLDEER